MKEGPNIAHIAVPVGPFQSDPQVFASDNIIAYETRWRKSDKSNVHF